MAKVAFCKLVWSFYGLVMLAGEKTSTSSSSSSELDPLLKDLTEKKLSFQRNIVSLASELKDVRSRLALREESFARESRTRQVGSKYFQHL